MTVYALDDKRIQTPASGNWWVAPSAVVLGNVIMHEDSSVWFGAVVRGDNDPITIGERSNVQDGAVLHTDMGFPLSIGPDVTIGHQAMLHGCTVGEGALIGIQALVMNGAVIGKHSLVGAKALVTEGKSFPERSLILGSPAKVVRELTDEEVEVLRLSAAGYVANYKRFKGGLDEDRR